VPRSLPGWLAASFDLFGLLFRSRSALVAENIFLRRQLAFYKERNALHRRPTSSAKLLLVLLGRFFDWREALVIVKPATLIRWHRAGFRLWWRWKSRKAGRPRLPRDLRALIRRMASENPSWGEERIADELCLKLGLLVDPRTIRKYVKQGRRPRAPSDQRWATFVRNHAKAMVACDFFVSVTATFRIVYVFVALKVGSRRILHCNTTEHPTAAWTVQQFREFLDGELDHRFVIHDRHGAFSAEVDSVLRGFGVHPLKTPVHSPTANAFCERLIGTIRRECLDYLIPINERHLKSILKEFVTYYNRARPHSSLGPGFPETIPASVPKGVHRHHVQIGYRIVETPVLGGLHHDYHLEKQVA
jgi:putative transposase